MNLAPLQAKQELWQETEEPDDAVHQIIIKNFY